MLFGYRIIGRRFWVYKLKTVKIKVELTTESETLVGQWLGELEWLWNQARRVALHNHSIEWYRWAEKKAKEKESDFHGVDLKGVVKCPLRLSKKGAWLGAACQIAVGGPYFVKDEKAPPVAYKWKGKLQYKPALKLVKGDHPYKTVPIAAHEFIELAERPIKKSAGLDNLGLLNWLREEQGLPPITLSSDYVGGLLKDFDTSWKAYLDAKLPDRKQPLFKDGRDRKTQTLSNAQNPPKWKGQKPKKGCGHFYCAGGIKAFPIDKNWEKRMGLLVPRSYKLTQKPSGWYLCISVATEAEALKPTLKARKNRRSSTIKKLHPGLSVKALSEVRNNDLDFQKLAQDVTDLEELIEQEAYENSPCRKTTGRQTGIDPGVKAAVATSDGALFTPNHARRKVKGRISVLQRRLDIMRNANDKRMGKQWKRGQREATANELKLQRKVSRLHERSANSANAYNHKLSTRLARTYDAISWEATQLGNMKRKAKPVLAESGTHYEQNNAAAKTGLNESLALASIGDLKAKTKAKLKISRKLFIESPAAYSSRICHCCGQEGDRPAQESFYCLNERCEMHGVRQHADVNAARNHEKALDG